jgi:hypothetical protein
VKLLQDHAVAEASRFRVTGLAAGVGIPMGQMEVTFSDGSRVLLSKAQYEAIRERR